MANQQLFNSEVFSIGDEGVKATVYVATDIQTTMYLTLAIFLGITLALAIYAKVLQ